MRNLLQSTVLLLFISISVQAQSKKDQDRQAIKDMCGCYEVTFKYAETFSPDGNYKKHDDYYASALEWAQLIEDEENKISIQHLLVVQDTMVIKHWRQDWSFEDPNLFIYDANNTWNLVEKDDQSIKGQWAQKVYQVDDSPRYSGSATWIHVDGKKIWQNTTPAPLPRREYTHRSDYNIMERNNQVQITTYGWLHEQDNSKVLHAADADDRIIAEEKGYNIYEQVADERCEAAQSWWKANQELWAKVRNEWDRILASKERLKLKKKVDGKRLYSVLFELKPTATTAEIHDAIIAFVE